MPEHPNSREAVIRIPERENLTAGGQPELEASRYCAYNQTRERFVCVDVEAADFSTLILESRLQALTPGCGKALWILPFRGISPTSVQVPIDLVYLDASFEVLAAVESFPIFRVPPSTVHAESVLALPAGTMGSTQTQPGDRLIVCSPDELKRHLLRTAVTKVDAHAEQSLSTGPSAARQNDQPAHKAPGNVHPWVDRSQPQSSNNDPPTEAGTSAVSDPSKPDPAPPQKKAPDSRNWLQRLLSAEPPDSRNSPREPLSWLAAYFFTGGTPIAQRIRDINSTGVYIFTEERWYLGTVIQITLADQRHRTPEYSLTVNAKVVRWGNDGAGLQFVLKDEKNLRHDKVSAPARSVEDVTRIHVEQFLRSVRSGAR